MEETRKPYLLAREALTSWEIETQKNIYLHDEDFIHSVQFYFPDEFSRINQELEKFGQEVPTHLEISVRENNLAANLPKLEPYTLFGERIDKIIHHPAYVNAGNIIYQTELLKKMSQAGGLLESLCFLFLSAQAGEAGHNCPIACSAGIIRVLQKTEDFEDKALYLEKLISPTYQHAFSGAQFLTEIQGGSDVGLNATKANQDEKTIWRIHGEKWFCSNAGANLIFLTARFDEHLRGTRGLGLFLVPAEWNGHKNLFTIRRLKEKIGTRSMATGEIDFHGAYAIAIGNVDEGFHLAMDNVLHISRLFNAFCVLGMARRAYFIAHAYAAHRVAFDHTIINYPLVKENLARIKTENTSMLAGMFATARLQDQYDKNEMTEESDKLLLRLLVNIQKYLTALWSVEHIHHALDVLAGNGTIESFSSLPRLLRDSIVCENWEGTHNILRMQVLKDILKYNIDDIFITHINHEIEKLKKFSQHIQPIKVVLYQLIVHCKELREMSSEIQSLNISKIVDKMAFIYGAINLLTEAIDQTKTTLSFSKFDCYHHFCMLHLEKNQLVYDHDYLDLITRITTS